MARLKLKPRTTRTPLEHTASWATDTPGHLTLYVTPFTTLGCLLYVLSVSFVFFFLLYLLYFFPLLFGDGRYLYFLFTRAAKHVWNLSLFHWFCVLLPMDILPICTMGKIPGSGFHKIDFLSKHCILNLTIFFFSFFGHRSKYVYSFYLFRKTVLHDFWVIFVVLLSTTRVGFSKTCPAPQKLRWSVLEYLAQI